MIRVDIDRGLSFERQPNGDVAVYYGGPLKKQSTHKTIGPTGRKVVIPLNTWTNLVAAMGGEELLKGTKP